MHPCIYVCADFVSHAFGAKRQARARASWRFQRQRNYKKHPKIIVRDCIVWKISKKGKYEIRRSIKNVSQKNPPNYCQGLSMFPVPDNKNVRNSRPLANVGNFQQNCNRASKGSTRTRTTTKRSACETIVRARAMQARSDNVWRDGKCAMQSLAKARHTHTHKPSTLPTGWED